MKSCPTSNMNRSKFWGFEVSHVIASLVVLAMSNILLNMVGAPILVSWGLGIGTLLVLRVVSHGQKQGHLEMLVKFITSPHIFLGHRLRRKENL
ncbi:MAG: hypothetical protein R3A80_09985 [Bdellovibrionota bacterium]